MQFLNATQIIESVQDAKTKVLKTIVTEQSFLKPLQAIVDAEAALAKATVKSFEEMVAKYKLV